MCSTVTCGAPGTTGGTSVLACARAVPAPTNAASARTATSPAFLKLIIVLSLHNLQKLLLRCHDAAEKCYRFETGDEKMFFPSQSIDSFDFWQHRESPWPITSAL